MTGKSVCVKEILHRELRRQKDICWQFYGHRLVAMFFDIFNDFFLFLILKSMNQMKFKRRKLFEVGLGLSHKRNQGKNVDKRT